MRCGGADGRPLLGSRRAEGIQIGERTRRDRAPSLMFIAGSPFFSLGPESISALRWIAVRRCFADGQTIHEQGDAAQFLDVVESGHVHLRYTMEDGSSVLYGCLASGETFGELGAFDLSAHADTASAVGQVSLLSLPAVAVVAIAGARHDVSKAMRLSVADRYKEYLTLSRGLGLQSRSTPSPHRPVPATLDPDDRA